MKKIPTNAAENIGTQPASRHGPRLLVSVRSAEEARLALRGGADFVDIKEPAAGSLGRSSPGVHVEVLGALRSEMDANPGLQRSVVVTAALGELMTSEAPETYTPVPGLVLYKLGLSGCARSDGWKEKLDAWRVRVADSGADLAAVSYADHQVANAPDPREVLDYAIAGRFPFFLIDTFEKKGRSLTDFLSEGELGDLLRHAHGHDVLVALAGSLRLEDLRPLAALRTDVLAVRGAACERGQRELGIDARRIEELVSLLDGTMALPVTGGASHSRSALGGRGA